jgi:hypothetical protein
MHNLLCKMIFITDNFEQEENRLPLSRCVLNISHILRTYRCVFDTSELNVVLVFERDDLIYFTINESYSERILFN